MEYRQAADRVDIREIPGLINSARDFYMPGPTQNSLGGHHGYSGKNRHQTRSLAA